MTNINQLVQESSVVVGPYGTSGVALSLGGGSGLDLSIGAFAYDQQEKEIARLSMNLPGEYRSDRIARYVLYSLLGESVHQLRPLTDSFIFKRHRELAKKLKSMKGNFSSQKYKQLTKLLDDIVEKKSR